MKKRIFNALTALKSNKGSSVVTVIVAMLFISILGAALLFATYTGLVVKVTEREGKQNFYTAEESMEIIRAGFQQVANDELKLSYTDAYTFFSYYNSVSSAGGAEDFEEIFANLFKHNVLRYNFGTIGTVSSLFTSTTPGGLDENFDPNTPIPTVELEIDQIIQYYCSVVSGIPTNNMVFISDTTGGYNVFIAGGGSQFVPAPIIELEPNSRVLIDDEKIIVEGLSVTQNDPNTRISTTIASDIVINVPDFAYSYSTTNVSSVPEFAFIVEDTVTAAGSAITLTGSAYMGEYIGNTFGSTLIASSGTVITAGNITLSNEAWLTLNDDTNLWATDIDIENSSVTLNGNSFIYDDLILSNEADVSINGEYIGYNSSSSIPEQSSAILVNGLDSELHLQNADVLTLAGRGFIGDTANSYLTTESLAIRSNQRVYLVPTEMLISNGDPDSKVLNPQVHGVGGASANVTLDLSHALWAGVNYSDYNLTAASVQPMTYPISGTNSITYYFFKFDSDENADKFFKDYFEQNPGDIDFYLDQYLDTLSVDDDVVSAEGYTFNREADDEITLYDPSASVATNASYAQTFENLTRTLTSNIPAAEGTTPYDYLVDTDAIDTFIADNGGGTHEFKDTSGNVVAVLTTESALNTNSVSLPGTVNFILVYNDNSTINVDSHYTGLILTNGNININAGQSVTADGSGVREALIAIYETTGISIGDFVTFKSNDSEVNELEDNSWDLDNIIEYANWTKK